MTHRSLVPKYIEDLKVYKAGKPIEELAREKNLTRISKLGSNENPLGPSPYAMKEMTNALWSVHRYPDMNAYELKMELSHLYDLKMENIVLGNGSEGIMAYIMRAFIQPGDEVVTSEKTFIGFQILAKGAGTKLIETARTEDFRFDVKAMAEAISEDTRLVYVANPDNPTGTYITSEEFNYLMKHVPSHCIVILDEAYFEFAKEHENYPDSMTYRYDNVITLRTFSKAYGICGIRIGYGFAHENFITNLHKVKLPFEPNLIAQRGAIGAIKDQPHLMRTINNNSKRMKETENILKRWKFEYLPSVTNFICFKTGSAQASDWLFNALLNRGVIIRPLIGNGMPEYLRISIGNKLEMQHFDEAMAEVMPKYIEKFKG